MLHSHSGRGELFIATQHCQDCLNLGAIITHWDKLTIPAVPELTNRTYAGYDWNGN